MIWMLSIWVATALLALCRGENTVQEGSSLSPFGYHLCVRNETRSVTFLAVHKIPYTVTEPCGGWLLWLSCTVTLYKITHQIENKTVMEQVTGCCDGYVQVGRYCALPENRSGEFTAKIGSCPTADRLYPGSEDCDWDEDCPGWQKCCHRSNRYVCSDPSNSTNYSENRGYRFNATVTVKADYEPLMATDKGHLNHTRLLQAMVTGALQSNASVYYLSTWPVHPYRTATSLLISCDFTLSLHNVTSELHLLLKHIQEVSSVTVEDVDECAHSALRHCSPQAHCNNTVGSYQCTCQQGYTDVDPSNPGAHCTAAVPTTTEPVNTQPPGDPAYAPALNTTESSTATTGFLNSTVSSTTTALNNTTSVLYNSSHALDVTPAAPHTSTSSPAESHLLTTMCTPPSITSLWSTYVTGTSFGFSWLSQFQMNQTYKVILRKGSAVIHVGETSQTTMEVMGLQPGVLYNVTVTPCACGSQGDSVHISIRTDAQTLDGTTRLTNIQFTADLQNTSSQAYKNLTESIIDEIYQSLPAEMKAMVDTGQVRIEITGLYSGSVVVNFTITFTPGRSQNLTTVSTALLHSLMNSTRYAVDENNTRINDFNECSTGEHDCSQWASCTNTWASYTCVCLDGFVDQSPERPGRACQALVTVTTSVSEVISTTTPSTTLTSSSVTQTAAPGVTTAQAITTHTPTTTTGPMTSITTPTTTTGPTTSITTPTTTTTQSAITTPTTTTTQSAITTPTITTTQSAITTTQTSTTTTTQSIITTPTTTTPQTTTTTTNRTHISILTTITTPTITSTQPATTNPITITTPTITTIQTTTTYPITTHSTPTTDTMTTTTATADPATITAIDALKAGAISVQCRGTAITVTVSRDFLQTANIRESTLYLGLLECGVNGGNFTHVQLTVAWDECTARLVTNETHYLTSITLLNTMDTYTSPNGTMEAPKIHLEVPIVCGYMKDMLVSADFGSMGYNMISDVIMGLGSFQVTVQLTNGTIPLPNNHSLSPEEAVVVDVSLNASSEQIKVVINKCWATPTQSPIDTYSHIFMENSCSLNIYTKVLTNGNSSTSRVSVQIFSFVNLNVIYLHCQVQICVQIGSSTCVPDCLQRTARASNTIGTGFGSSGPLLKSETDPLEEELNTIQVIGLSCLGVGLSICFIVAFVCLFYYQRNRIGHYNFSTKPKQENFTYLVFNT